MVMRASKKSLNGSTQRAFAEIIRLSRTIGDSRDALRLVMTNASRRPQGRLGPQRRASTMVALSAARL
jgi:hypothetical protein